MIDLTASSFLRLLLVCALVWNSLTFAIFAYDKHAARRQLRRVPERRLILLIITFGATGALLAQRWLRHKTRKPPFDWLVPFMASLQAALLTAATVLLTV